MENEQILLQAPTLDKIAQAMATLAPAKGEAVMILVAEKVAIELGDLQEELNQQDGSYFGGLFPGVIYGEARYEDAVVLRKLTVVHPPFVVKAVTQFAVPDFELATAPQRRGMICLVDGLMTGINACLEQINNRLGDRFSFIGGGAGSLSLVQQPCLFTRDGVYQDAALCCLLDQRLRLGIRHGWQRLAGPFVVTDAEGNTIKALNWEKAAKVYNQTLLADNDSLDLSADNFFAVASSYPLGLIREHAEDVVRDPIIVNEEGHIICVGEVPVNSVVHILKGEPQQLIDAAQRAFQEATPATALANAFPLLIVDCISRALFLDAQFDQELKELQGHSSSYPPLGVLSLGEIASFNRGALEFFNKTIVLGQLLA